MNQTARLALLLAIVATAATATHPRAEEAAAPGPAPEAPLAPPAPAAPPAGPPADAAAPPPEPLEAPPPPGVLAIGAHLGMFTGMGAGLQLGTQVAGLRVAAGWAPLLFAVTERTTTAMGTEDEVKLKFYSGLLVSPDVYLRVAQSRLTSIGIQGGYRYSSILGSGGAAGIYVEHPLGRRIDLLVNGGLLFFPEGETKLERREHLQNPDFGFPGPNVSIALSAGLLFFP